MRGRSPPGRSEGEPGSPAQVSVQGGRRGEVGRCRTAASGRRRRRRPAARSAAPCLVCSRRVRPAVPTTAPGATSLARVHADRRPGTSTRSAGRPRGGRRRGGPGDDPGEHDGARARGPDRRAGTGREIDTEVPGAVARRRRPERAHDHTGDGSDHDRAPAAPTEGDAPRRSTKDAPRRHDHERRDHEGDGATDRSAHRADRTGRPGPHPRIRPGRQRNRRRRGVRCPPPHRRVR